MKELLKKSLIAFGLLMASAAEKCDNYETKTEQKLKERGYTQEQAEVLTAASFRYMLTDEVKNEDGTSTYNLNYSAITEEDILDSVKKMHDGMEESIKSLTMADIKYTERTAFGKRLEKEEAVFKYLEDMLNKKVLHVKFKKMIRENEALNAYDPYKINKDEKYSLSTIFPFKEDKLDFDAKYVTAARNDGKLKDPASIVEEVTEQEKYFEKVRNPNYPATDKNNEFVYKERKGGIKIISYNLDDDSEKIPDYIEAYRMNEKGKQESLPAIRIFKPNGSGQLEVILADSDFEGEDGYGMPDYLQQAFTQIDSAYDVFSLDAVGYVFRNMGKKDNARPEMNDLNKICIVRAGADSSNNYDINPSGWESYLPEYKTGKAAVKFTVQFKSKEAKEDEEENMGEIEWVAKLYPNNSRVVEFYKLGEKFEKEHYKISKVLGKIVSMLSPTGQIEQYNIDAVIEEVPFRIDFDRNHEKRWVLMDKDNDRKHYEAKREVAWTRDIIPK